MHNRCGLLQQMVELGWGIECSENVVDSSIPEFHRAPCRRQHRNAIFGEGNAEAMADEARSTEDEDGITHGG